MGISKDDLEAVGKIIDILGPFDHSDRARILRWASEKVEVGFKRPKIDPEQLTSYIKEIDLLSTRARNERDKIQGHFQNWTEKGDQVDQLLSAVLRTMKEMQYYL